MLATGQHVFTVSTIEYTIGQDKLASHTESMVNVEVNNGQLLNCLLSFCPIKYALCIMYVVQPAPYFAVIEKKLISFKSLTIDSLSMGQS